MLRCCLLLLLALPSLAQLPRPTHPRVESGWQREATKENSFLKGLPIRSVGPTIMSGRVTDLAVDPNDPKHFYVAFASGGLWVTDNNGQSFKPLFDAVPAASIGDIAVDWRQEPELLWVGTGENNSSRSSYSGTGIYYSENLGKTWEYRGLAATHHIGRIRLDPQRPQVIWVAALGHLYSKNPQRGIYKSTDGGHSWEKSLFVSDSCGAIDLFIHPAHPDTLFASTWERQRWAWNFKGRGGGAAIHRSTDGGKIWQRLAAQTGFPQGDRIGRIGLDGAWFRDTLHLYALLDNQNLRGEKSASNPLQADSLEQMSTERFLRIPRSVLESFLKEHDFPKRYTIDYLMQALQSNRLQPKDLIPFISDANAALFQTRIKGAELYYSTDLGQTWQLQQQQSLEGLYFTYGYYFGQVRVHPKNPKSVYILGVPLLHSTDGGKHFNRIGKANVHVDHHALWLNPQREGHLINGNDGGVVISYDNGRHWSRCNSPAVGQFYSVAVDNEQPYNIYGGMQDNGVWKGPSDYQQQPDWEQMGHYPYKRLLGGDGMQVEIDNSTGNIITGFQFGHYFQLKEGQPPLKIRPQPEGEALRFNWKSPILLSPHQSDILYLGSQYLHRSFEQGQNWEQLPKDLAPSRIKGAVPYGSLTCISESPLRFGLLYVGSDNGYLHRSEDAGRTWEALKLPIAERRWVSSLRASPHKEGRLYLSLNGYRQDDFKAYLFRSDDYGETWMDLGQQLPLEPINVVLESPFSEKLLFVGTDQGLYVSLDAGKQFSPLALPAVAVHDLSIQEREQELVIATHGRSLYTVPLKALQELVHLDKNTKAHIFGLADIKHQADWGRVWSPWFEAKAPKPQLPYYAMPAGESTWSLYSEDGQLLERWKTQQGAGLHYLEYDLHLSQEAAEAWNKNRKNPIQSAKNGRYYLPVGTYRLELQHGEQRHTEQLKVVAPE